MPVTTTPTPLMTNARSTARRNSWSDRDFGALRGSRRDVLPQHIEARAVDTGGANDSAEAQAGFAGEARHRIAHALQSIAVHAVRFGNGGNTAFYAEQPQKREVLQRLRHRTVVSGNHQQCMLMCRNACDHVVNEAVVARHVDEADPPAGDVGVGKTEIDGESAASFLGERVCIHARQSLDEAGLAVIDVARERDDHASESGESRTQCIGVVDRAHVQPQHAVLNAPDHRRVEASQPRCQFCDVAIGLRRNRYGHARQRLLRQGATADLAFAGCRIDRKSGEQSLAQRGSNALCERGELLA